VYAKLLSIDELENENYELNEKINRNHHGRSMRRRLV
jgi:hypothetical protein